MAGTSREFAITHGPQLPAQGLLGDGDTELFEDPLSKIDQAPAYDAVDRRDRAPLDHAGDRLALCSVEFGGPAWRLAIQQAVSASRVEPQHPVADNLKADPADLRSLGTPRAVVDCSQRQ